MIAVDAAEGFDAVDAAGVSYSPAEVARKLAEGSAVILTFLGAVNVWEILLDAAPDADALFPALLDSFDCGIDFLADNGYRVPLDAFVPESAQGEPRTAKLWRVWRTADANKALVRTTAGGKKVVWVPSSTAKPPQAPFRSVGECLLEHEACPPDQTWMTNPPALLDHFFVPQKK